MPCPVLEGNVPRDVYTTSLPCEGTGTSCVHIYSTVLPQLQCGSAPSCPAFAQLPPQPQGCASRSAVPTVAKWTPTADQHLVRKFQTDAVLSDSEAFALGAKPAGSVERSSEPCLSLLFLGRPALELLLANCCFRLRVFGWTAPWLRCGCDASGVIVTCCMNKYKGTLLAHRLLVDVKYRRHYLNREYLNLAIM